MFQCTNLMGFRRERRRSKRKVVLLYPGHDYVEKESIHMIQAEVLIKSIIYQNSTLLNRMWKST
ncbi:unnamed protein product [Rhodiola kirilowii]